MEEIVKALKCMKAGKATGYDSVCRNVTSRARYACQLYRLFNLCWTNGRVPKDWCKTVIVPLYKGKGSQQECKNYSGISLLSVVGKLYAKILIERVMKETIKYGMYKQDFAREWGVRIRSFPYDALPTNFWLKARGCIALSSIWKRPMTEW
jgi:hypothetical protein